MKLHLCTRALSLVATLALLACEVGPIPEMEGPDAAQLSQGAAASMQLPYQVVDTDQYECYDDATTTACPGPGAPFAGQDGQLEGAQPAYLDNGDGTVSDLRTGLMWQQDPGSKMTWDAAVAGAAGMSLAGYGDWRLPTIKELYSLILFSGTDVSVCMNAGTCEGAPFIDAAYFDFSYGDTSAGERMIDAQFASSTEYVDTTMGGAHTIFGVNFADGRIKGYPTAAMPGQAEGKTFFVLYVRDGADYGLNDLGDNGDGTVTDAATGLMWTQGDSGHYGAGELADGGLNWEQALAFCQGLSSAGHDDWRLPNAKELQSLVDYDRAPATTGTAAIDPIFASTQIVGEDGEADFPFYWSSTTHADSAGGGGWAAYVAFGTAFGYMPDPRGGSTLMDVHGAGAQRSDPKSGDPADYASGHGPQGDVVRIYNHARCVRDAGTVDPGPVCGDGVCEQGEDCSGCASDCGACPPVCGDGVCESDETCGSCASDCGACPPVCGDGVCEGGESCQSCASDCGACSPVCGDGRCEQGETCQSCASDCGACETGCRSSRDCPLGMICGLDRRCRPASRRRPPRRR